MPKTFVRPVIFHKEQTTISYGSLDKITYSLKKQVHFVFVSSTM